MPMKFKGFNCPVCGTPLPIELRYDNFGMVRVWCQKCGKCCYINKLELLRKEKSKILK